MSSPGHGPTRSHRRAGLDGIDAGATELIAAEITQSGEQQLSATPVGEERVGRASPVARM